MSETATLIRVQTRLGPRWINPALVEALDTWGKGSMLTLASGRQAELRMTVDEAAEMLRMRVLG